MSYVKMFVSFMNFNHCRFSLVSKKKKKNTLKSVFKLESFRSQKLAAIIAANFFRTLLILHYQNMMLY